MQQIEDFLNKSKLDQAEIIEGLPRQNKGRKVKIYGVGINNAIHPTFICLDGTNVKHPAYVAWKEMLKRCYSRKYLKKRPTYDGTEVCEDWKVFSNFKDWWKLNYKQGYVLDKDILSYKRQKLYSPDTCVYVPLLVNSFITFRENKRGCLPVGVHLCIKSGKYVAQCGDNGNRIYLGKYETPEQAYDEWLKHKLGLLEDYKEILDSIDTRLYSRLKVIVKEAI